jgi:hypothetical protein
LARQSIQGAAPRGDDRLTASPEYESKPDFMRLAHSPCLPECNEGSHHEILRSAQNDNAERPRGTVYECFAFRLRGDNLIMFRVFRHDTITLHSEVREEDFERFMKEALVPHFSEQCKGPTRSSIADLKSQSLFKDAKSQRKYLWITVWDGSPESVRGLSFEHTRMSRPEAAEAISKFNR